MKFIVDRIEEGIVILENERQEIIEEPMGNFDFALAEGDVINYADGKYSLDCNDKKQREKEIETLVDDLFI